MNWADWTIIAVIGLSTALSLMRGFVKEALSLAAWVAAFFISTIFATRLAAQLLGLILNDALRYAAAYVILFAATIMLGALLNSLLAQLIKMTGLSGMDRLLGTVFGFARGLVVVLVVVFVARALVPESQVIDQSVLLPHLMLVAQWAETNFSSLMGDGTVSWLQ